MEETAPPVRWRATSCVKRGALTVARSQRRSLISQTWTWGQHLLLFVAHVILTVYSTFSRRAVFAYYVMPVWKTTNRRCRVTRNKNTTVPRLSHSTNNSDKLERYVVVVIGVVTVAAFQVPVDVSLKERHLTSALSSKRIYIYYVVEKTTTRVRHDYLIGYLHFKQRRRMAQFYTQKSPAPWCIPCRCQA